MTTAPRPYFHDVAPSGNWWTVTPTPPPPPWTRPPLYPPIPPRTLPNGPQVFVFAQTSLGKGLSLWNGSGNDAPPSGWETPGFDDSAWGLLYDQATGATGSPAVAAGGIWIRYPVDLTVSPENVLVRQHIALPAGTVVAASLSFRADDTPGGIYIDGTLVPYSNRVPDAGPWLADTVDLSPTLLSGGTSVLIAGSFWNATGAGVGDAAAFVTLRITLDVLGVAPLSYEDAVLADSPLAYWPLDEASGTTFADASGNGHTGTRSTGTLTYGVAGPQAGSQALGFAGAESISIPAVGAFPPAGNVPFTIEAWVLQDAATAAFGGVLGYGTFATGANSLNTLVIEGPFPPGPGHLGSRVNAYWGGSVLHDAADHILIHAWHHVAVTYDGTTTCVYRDGVVVATSSTAVPAFVSTDVLIGVADPAPGNQYFYGALASVALYDYALSATRILAHYNAGGTAGSPVVEPNLVRLDPARGPATGGSPAPTLSSLSPTHGPASGGNNLLPALDTLVPPHGPASGG